MILVDTSVWVHHFRFDHPRLRELLLQSQVVTHPFVVGELACGSLVQRGETLGALLRLPGAVAATHAEVLRMVEERRLWGRGIGWIDAHLLASAVLSGAHLWSLDEPLRRAAAYLKVEAALPD